jgi:diacylglycerol kinase family enzyme
LKVKKKILFIVNPKAGTGRQKGIEEAIKEHLDADLFDYTVQVTDHAHHGTELAREAADKGYDCVVAVGGDGSVNDVAQGLRGSNVTLGIIP